MGLDLVQAVLVFSRTPRLIELGIHNESRDPVFAKQARREHSGLEADEDHRRIDHVSGRDSAPILGRSDAAADVIVEQRSENCRSNSDFLIPMVQQI